MKTHRIDLASVSADRAVMKYQGKAIGVSHQPLFDAARYLLGNGLADEADRIETYRNGVLCLRGTVKAAAFLSVGKSTLRFVRYRPFDLGVESAA